ncbi:MAG TPA: tRNA (adenosine(37)-N6)-threonylcarbamoyltransferase complex ATPase subunit type 1 TsaE [Candidatus Saccharimonadia bacterium]|jgi:tRNA threonylcarbamoyladenosine biosynthesis protein TsaE
MNYEISTTNSEATQALATKLAKHLKGGEVIELASDLGGGKTTFVQGLARGLGYHGDVTSPTFTLSQIYKLPSLEIHHYDLYRLGETGVVGDELTEDLHDPFVVTVIEWGGIMEAHLPKDRLRISFEVTGDNDRRLTFTAGGPVSEHLLKELKS